MWFAIERETYWEAVDGGPWIRRTARRIVTYVADRSAFWRYQKATPAARREGCVHNGRF